MQDLPKYRTKKLKFHAPRGVDSGFVEFHGFWLEVGPLKAHVPEDYILTPSIRNHVRDLARIMLTRKYPILLQGPTSSGKTSMVEYLAQCTGHRFVRINNHEHTDIQEYLGSYIPDTSGNLVFHEGILVEAVRNVCLPSSSPSV